MDTVTNFIRQSAYRLAWVVVLGVLSLLSLGADFLVVALGDRYLQVGTAREFLARSWNFGACAAADTVGLEAATQFVGRVTGTHPEATGMSALGGTAGAELSLLQLTQAYTLFPNNGLQVAATPFLAYAQDGARVALPRPVPPRVAEAGATSVTTDMLRGVVSAGGTAPNFRAQAGLAASVNFAGKTGSGTRADLWFVGFTPRLVVGVWAGMPNNEVALTLEKGFSGGNVAAPVAAAFLRSVAQQRPELLAGEFAQPANIATRRADR